MGILSKLKKGVSKAWSGVKKAVKGVAKGVKKVAKGVVTALPGGQKLWKEAGRLGTKVMKGIGKISSKLGPIGMMALSFVLAPVMGPMISSLWSGFGAGAATMAASANAFVSTLGTAGSGIFAAGNWIGGTLGAMGNAITESASNIMQGNFSGAATSFASNMTNAFTGKAGMASVNAAAAQAANAAGTLANNAASTITEAQVSQFGADGINMMSPASAPVDLTGMTAEQIANQKMVGILPGQAAQEASFAALNSSPVGLNTAGMTAEQLSNNAILGYVPQATLDSQVATYGMTAAQMNAIPNAANAFVTNGVSGATGIAASNIPSTGASGWDKTKAAASAAKSMLGGSGGSDGYQPYVPKAITSQRIGNASNSSGTGSSGFSLLGGVQGLEQSIRGSQQMMFG